MVKVNIIENKDRKTITVIFGGVRFYSAKYLLERYNDERYFGQGILNIDAKEMKTIVNRIVSSLNLVNPEVKVSGVHFVENDNNPYPIFKTHKNMEDKWDGTFEVVLGAFAKNPRNLFFEDLARTKPVTNEQVIKEYEWGIELEFGSKRDENTSEVKIQSILHRIIRGKKAQLNFMSNDDAWAGFELEEEENPEDEKNSITDYDDELGF